MLLYNLFLYSSLKYSQYLFYISYMFFVIIFKATQSGIPIEYFELSSKYYGYLYYSFFLATISYLLFIKKVLRAKKFLPLIDKIFDGMSIMLGVLFLYVLFFVKIYDFVYPIYIIIFSGVFMLPLYIYAYYKKVPGSVYVLLANIPFLLIVTRSEFLFFGWIDYDYFSRFGHMGALVYESLAFSLLVSYYIKGLNKENELQKSVLFQKEKQSALGELLVYITHQWRAPLTRLSSIITLNETKLKKGHTLSN